MIVAMSCNEAWYKYLVVDLYSLLFFTPNIEKIYLFLETDNIDEVKYLKDLKNRFNVEFVLINYNNFCDKYLSITSPNRDTLYSNFCFSRLILADFIKEDKVIYLDTDAIVRRDISRIWNIDINDYYVIGVKDYGVMCDGYLDSLNLSGKYINSGVVVFNLEKIRKDNIISKWFDIINNKKLLYPDQDALNIVCTDYEYYIHSMYNFINNATLDVVNKELVKIYHYAGPKNNWLADRFYAEEWYDSEELFYKDIVKGQN